MICVNTDELQLCAFCKYWQDPLNEAIKPKAPRLHQWLYDKTAIHKCIKYGTDMPSFGTCQTFALKF